MFKKKSVVPNKALFVSFLALFLLLVPALSSAKAYSGGGEEKGATDFILHHVVDDHVWHFFDGEYGTLYLPIILYSEDRGLEVFSSHHFYDDHHEKVAYNGYELGEDGHIAALDAGRHAMDFSITKNTAMLILTMIVLSFIALRAASHYKKNPKTAPKGVASFLEPIIIYVRDEIAKPNIGKKYEKFMPYLLTLFFFIWLGNLLGLIPGASNLTGNIAVTFVLAVFTFIATNVNGNKEYWKHVFATPGVPKPLLLIMVPVEFIGLFTKPFSLMVRLFVAITAGHIVILSLIGLVFIFQSHAVGVASTVMVIFINMIELLVATIQAYVFTLFSAMYIGAAVADHDHH
ncbi:F0F1 ATP synthase subunit A [uncultured Roseivirga sp.]|uniref:F0F1 ATP synthase subunit A n=1 Tax=uncultured Roseivirga sp. TaxID=543088 RepID=UPI0030DA62F3|tara:strand:+ start:86406 stop:87443 length:1038 start_codon:yes stop_codon:yes gene_type:complete